MESIEVYIMGKKYALRAENTEKVKQYADHLNSLLDDISSKYGIVESKDILVLAAMVLTEKMFLMTEESNNLRQEIESLNGMLSSFFLEIKEQP